MVWPLAGKETRQENSDGGTDSANCLVQREEYEGEREVRDGDFDGVEGGESPENDVVAEG
jgi:hypothetical protein